MKRLLALVFLPATLAQADDEITIELPGGVPLEMVWIEPGNFTMGSPEYDGTREVTISNGFYLGKYELTREQWQAVMGTAPWSSQESDPQGPRLPANISWHDAQEFAQRLNDHFGQDAYRLPTEAEWEYACRAGTTTRWFFGDDESQLASYAWYEANAMGDVHSVGEKLPNPWGLFDMYGNALEWVWDWGSRDYYDGTPTTDPSGPFWGHSRILRGGGHRWSAEYVSSFRQEPHFPHFDGSVYGEAPGMRLLKGEPLDLPTPTPFPQDSSGPFLPVHEGNIWIMAVYDPVSSANVSFSAYVLERSEVIDGKQYWEWQSHLTLPMIRGPFRVDEKGIWELIQERWTSDALNELLGAIDANPELRESQYYKQSAFFQSLEPDQKEFLLYDFVGGTIDYDSPTIGLDGELVWLHAITFELGRYIKKEEWSVPDQEKFSWVCCGTEAGEGWIIFQRGLGPVSITISDPHGWFAPTQDELVWARIDGVEYGLHPGPDYPGYRQIETVVASPEMKSAYPVTSRLSPNFPNPFNASTQIAYHLATPGPVRLRIYNTLGQPVRTLVNQFQPAGSYQVRWDARDQEGSAVSAGIYLLRLNFLGGEQTRRLLLLK